MMRLDPSSPVDRLLRLPRFASDLRDLQRPWRDPPGFFRACDTCSTCACCSHACYSWQVPVMTNGSDSDCNSYNGQYVNLYESLSSYTNSYGSFSCAWQPIGANPMGVALYLDPTGATPGSSANDMILQVRTDLFYRKTLGSWNCNGQNTMTRCQQGTHCLGNTSIVINASCENSPYYYTAGCAVPCCPGVTIPTTLYVHFSSDTTCTWLTGQTIPITLVSCSSATWQSASFVNPADCTSGGSPSGGVGPIQLTCLGVAGWLFACPGLSVAVPVPWTCNPFFAYGSTNHTACPDQCGTPSLIKWTITP